MVNTECPRLWARLAWCWSRLALKHSTNCWKFVGQLSGVTSWDGQNISQYVRYLRFKGQVMQDCQVVHIKSGWNWNIGVFLAIFSCRNCDSMDQPHHLSTMVRPSQSWKRCDSASGFPQLIQLPRPKGRGHVQLSFPPFFFSLFL